MFPLEVLQHCAVMLGYMHLLVDTLLYNFFFFLDVKNVAICAIYQQPQQRTQQK